MPAAGVRPMERALRRVPCMFLEDHIDGGRHLLVANVQCSRRRAGGRAIVVGFWVCAGLGWGDAVALPKWRCSASAAKDRSGGARSSFSPSPAVEILPLENAMHDLLLSCSWRRSAMHTSLRIEMVAFIALRPCMFFFIMETKFQCTIPTQPHLCNNRLEIWVRSKLAKKVYIYIYYMRF